MAKNGNGNAHVTITVDGKQAVSFYKQLQKEEITLNKLAKQGDKEAEKKLHNVQTLLTNAKKELASIDDVLKGKVFANLGKLEQMAKNVKLQMRYAETAEDLRKLQVQYRGLTDRIRDLTNQTQLSSHAFGNLARRAAEYATFYSIINRGSAILKNAIQGNLALSDSISDIQKVSGLSEEAVKGLVTQIEKIDSRNTPETLNQMAYAAGKLGIKGAENLLGFTRAADKLNVALKEYLGDGAEGVVKLMKFANVMGTTDQYGVEQALIKTGSALNYMTQSTAAAADYMIEFAGRFGPIARQARMTSGDVIGLASALDALTVNNEEAATALQRFVVRLLSAPTAVSKALGMNAQLSKEMVETGKSIELVEMALGKLAERSQKYGVSGISSVIGDISKGQAQRLIKTLATLSNNTEMVSNYVEMANKAFQEGTSIIEEYNIKNQNAAAIMERTRNSWQKVMVNSENVGIVKDLTLELYKMSKELQSNTYLADQLRIAIGMLFGIVQNLIKLLPVLIPLLTTIGTMKLAAAIGAWTKALWLNAAQISANIKIGFSYLAQKYLLRRADEQITVSSYAAAKAQKALSAAMATTAIGLAVVAVGLLVGKIAQLVTETLSAESAMDKLNRIEKEHVSTLEAEQMEAKNLFRRLEEANGKTEERRKLIKTINEKYGSYLTNMLTEQSTAQDIAKAYEEVNKQLKRKIALQARDAAMQEIIGDDMQKNVEAQTAIEEIFKRQGKGSVAAGALDEAKNKYDEYVKAGMSADDIKKLVMTELFGERGKYGEVYKGLKANKDRGWTMGNVLDFFGVEGAERITDYQWSKESLERAVSNYIGSLWNKDVHVKQIDRKFGRIEDLTEPEVGGGGGGGTTVLEDGGGGAGGSKVDKEKEQAKQDVQAIKSELTAFYEWRESEINKMRDMGEITETVKDMWIAENKKLHATSEMNAWNYLLQKDGAKEAWEVQMQTMQTEILNSNPQMQALWKHIGEVNMEALGNTLQRLGSQEKGGMEKTIAQDAAIIQQYAAKMAETVQKELDKYDMEKQVRNKFAGALTQMGLFTTQWQNGIHDGFKNATEAADAGMRELALLSKDVFKYDITTDEGEQAFRLALDKRKYLALDAAHWTKEQLQLMYEQLIEFDEQMTDATRKHYQKEKKRQETRFNAAGYTEQEKTTDKALEATGKQKSAGIGQTFAEQIGLGNIMTDPEVQRIQNRIYWRNMELQDAQQHLAAMQALQQQELKDAQERGASEQEIENLRMQHKQANEAQEMLIHDRQTGLMQATQDMTIQIAQQMKSRVEAIKNLAKPITDFAQAAGRKIGDMITHMESEESSWEELWKNMALAVGESVIQMGAQYAQNVIMQQAAAKASEATAIEEAEVGTMAGIAEGSAKTIGKLGWWGIPLVAVISALLMGLLQSALATKKNVDSSSSSSSNKSSLRLVKGMLTYDEGNVQTFLQAKEGGAYTVLGNDGRVYSARKQSELKTGIVKSPIATMVNGQPSLVAERGPEMVIGRRTLRDMTLFRPDLVQQIIKFDRNRRHGFRTYDEGNLDELALQTSNLQPQTSNQADLLAALQESKAVNEQTAMAVGALVAELRRGIGVRKYGTGGLVEEVIDGLYTTKKKNTSPMLRRLLGT